MESAETWKEEYETSDAELAAKLSKDAPVRSGYTTRAKEDTRAKKKAAAFTRPVRRWEKGPAMLGHISVPKWRVSAALATLRQND